MYACTVHVCLCAWCGCARCVCSSRGGCRVPRRKQGQPCPPGSLHFLSPLRSPPPGPFSGRVAGVQPWLHPAHSRGTSALSSKDRPLSRTQETWADPSSSRSSELAGHSEGKGGPDPRRVRVELSWEQWVARARSLALALCHMACLSQLSTQAQAPTSPFQAHHYTPVTCLQFSLSICA